MSGAAGLLFKSVVVFVFILFVFSLFCMAVPFVTNESWNLYNPVFHFLDPTTFIPMFD